MADKPRNLSDVNRLWNWFHENDASLVGEEEREIFICNEERRYVIFSATDGVILGNRLGHVPMIMTPLWSPHVRGRLMSVFTTLEFVRFHLLKAHLTGVLDDRVEMQKLLRSIGATKTVELLEEAGVIDSELKGYLTHVNKVRNQLVHLRSTENITYKNEPLQRIPEKFNADLKYIFMQLSQRYYRYVQQASFAELEHKLTYHTP